MSKYAPLKQFLVRQGPNSLPMTFREIEDVLGFSLLKGATGDWEIVVGLEVHAQVLSEAKLFSGASAHYGGAPNAHVKTKALRWFAQRMPRCPACCR